MTQVSDDALLCSRLAADCVGGLAELLMLSIPSVAVTVTPHRQCLAESALGGKMLPVGCLPAASAAGRWTPRVLLSSLCSVQLVQRQVQLIAGWQSGVLRVALLFASITHWLRQGLDELYACMVSRQELSCQFWLCFGQVQCWLMSVLTFVTCWH